MSKYDITKSEKFIEEILEQYKISSKLYNGKGSYNIRRGTAHTVAGFSEDLFALFIAEDMGNHNIAFYVDKSISARLPQKRRATTFRPDLAIVTPSVELTHYFDLKTNLGWHRDLISYLKAKNDFIEQLINKNQAWITKRWDWKDLDKVTTLSISRKLKYHIVILFGGNINKEQLEANISFAEELEFIKLDVLRYGDETNHQGFKNILSSLEDIS